MVWRCECGCINALTAGTCISCGATRPAGQQPEPSVNGAGDMAELTPEILSQLKSMTYFELVSVPRTSQIIDAVLDGRGQPLAVEIQQAQSRIAGTIRDKINRPRDDISVIPARKIGFGGDGNAVWKITPQRPEGNRLIWGKIV